MYRRSRIRRIAKWTGVAVCLMLLVGWVVSLQWTADWTLLLSDGTIAGVYLRRGEVIYGS